MKNLTMPNMNNAAVETGTVGSYSERENEVLQFCSDNLKYYKQSGTRNRINYYLLNSALIVLSSVLPIMVVMAPEGRLLNAAVAAVVGMLTTVNSFYRFRENWIKNINAAHALSIELTKFRGRAGHDYLPTLDAQTALNNLMKHYEAIAETALTEWRTIVSTTPTNLGSQPTNRATV